MKPPLFNPTRKTPHKCDDKMCDAAAHIIIVSRSTRLNFSQTVPYRLNGERIRSATHAWYGVRFMLINVLCLRCSVHIYRNRRGYAIVTHEARPIILLAQKKTWHTTPPHNHRTNKCVLYYSIYTCFGSASFIKFHAAHTSGMCVLCLYVSMLPESCLFNHHTRNHIGCVSWYVARPSEFLSYTGRLHHVAWKAVLVYFLLFFVASSYVKLVLVWRTLQCSQNLIYIFVLLQRMKNNESYIVYRYFIQFVIWYYMKSNLYAITFGPLRP